MRLGLDTVRSRSQTSKPSLFVGRAAGCILYVLIAIAAKSQVYLTSGTIKQGFESTSPLRGEGGALNIQKGSPLLIMTLARESEEPGMLPIVLKLTTVFRNSRHVLRSASERIGSFIIPHEVRPVRSRVY